MATSTTHWEEAHIGQGGPLKVVLVPSDMPLMVPEHTHTKSVIGETRGHRRVSSKIEATERVTIARGKEVGASVDGQGGLTVDVAELLHRAAGLRDRLGASLRCAMAAGTYHAGKWFLGWEFHVGESGIPLPASIHCRRPLRAFLELGDLRQPRVTAHLADG